MKKLFQSLPFRLLAGVVIGILAGLTANETFMNIIVTLKQVMGQIITFCVPLIVIGFIAPSITRLGKNASKMLGVALLIAWSRIFRHAGRLWTDSPPFHRFLSGRT